MGRQFNDEKDKLVTELVHELETLHDMGVDRHSEWFETMEKLLNQVPIKVLQKVLAEVQTITN